jgi:N-acylneuraminate cytidylyltransferase
VIGGRSTLGVITARGGSKGLPGKNILPAAGRPLIAWTIDAALASESIDRLVLSTDDDAIADVARRHGCEVPFRRPAELATDSATSIDVLLHALEQLPPFDVVVLLQPTSPLRTAQDIDATCALVAAGAPAAVSVAPVEQSPYWMYRLGGDRTLDPILPLPPGVSRRQDLPPVYALNGAVYVADVAWLRQTRTFLTPQTVAHVMPAERSIDIDTAADFDAFLHTIQRDPRVAEVPRPTSHRPRPLPEGRA